MKKEKWWIYEGDDSLEIRQSRLKGIPKPNWRNKNELKYTAQKFIANKEIIDAVNASIYLRRPLLVTGKPGVGKSTLAKAIAHNLGLGNVLSWHVTSRSVLQDSLYSYDAFARLQDTQITKNSNFKELDNVGIENYLKLGALGTAFSSQQRRVVLIDEIDKCDRDLPNDLLHVFEEQEFEIPELKRLSTEKVIIQDSEGNSVNIKRGKIVAQNDFPIIIMTSNGEQEFPPAFLRRCISVEFKMSSFEELREMVYAHFPDIEENNKDKINDIINEFMILSEVSLHSNDQLLNAIYLLLSSDAKYDDFVSSVISPIE